MAEMPLMNHYVPMPRVILIAFDGVQGLDVMGPAEVFAGVARHTGGVGYEVIVAAARGGTIRATSGVPMTTVDLGRLRPVAEDTAIVAGGEEEAVRAAVACRPLVPGSTANEPGRARRARFRRGFEG